MLDASQPGLSEDAWPRPVRSFKQSKMVSRYRGLGCALVCLVAPAIGHAQPATSPVPAAPTPAPASGPAGDTTARPVTQAATTEAGPTTAPATAPTYTLSTPKDALKYFAAALRDGDADRLRKSVLTANDAEAGMVGAIAQMAAALTGLHQSAAKAFGPEAARKFTDDTAAGFDQTVARIDAAEVTIDAETAVVRYADAKDNPYELKRVGEEWKVLATQFTHGADPAALDRRVGELGVQTRIVDELAKEIDAGKHKTAEAAGLAWRSKMMGALSGEGAKTKPATLPQ